jgi:thiamine biosynthesis lipoprotein
MVDALYRFPFEAMASRCEIRLAAPDESTAEELAFAAIAEVRRVERTYSRYRADSVVSHINAAAGRYRVDCDDETVQLLDYADHLYRVSGGLFDITSGVLRRAWDFRQLRVPNARDLAPLLALVDWASVQRDDNAIFLPRAGMEIDFGGFGKEYAADRACALLQERGVRHGYVNLGGDMRFIGPQPDGRLWSIGIQDPRREDGTVASIAVSQGALTTSGDYERFIDVDGKRYCHVLNPRTGMPVSYWRSVSVLAPLAVLGGSVSTIAMLKEGDGLSFLDAGGLAYFAIDSTGQEYHHSISGDYAS